ncbi:MAG: zinc-ribbon domain-containing protein [Oscillospiraceae bacterium]
MSKFCKSCGAELTNDNAEFCNVCGAPQSNSIPNVNTAPMQGGMPQPNPMGYQTPPMYQQPVYPTFNNYSEDTTVMGWIGWSILCSILPIIGQIIIIATAKNKTLKNWAIAQFVIMAVVVVITIVCFAIFGATVSSVVEDMCMTVV